MAGILFITVAILSAPQPQWLIAAILLHETGHFLTAILFKWELPRFCLNGSGMRLVYGSFHPTHQTLCVLLSGCAVGLICAFIPCFPKEFRLFSLGLSIMNLFPVSVLDGGEILTVILERFLLPDNAFRVIRVTSVTAVICLWVLSSAVQLKAGINLSLLAVSVYLTVSVLKSNDICQKTK